MVLRPLHLILSQSQETSRNGYKRLLVFFDFFSLYYGLWYRLALKHMSVHDWVSKIKLASITRPDWVFVPVWITLSFLIESQNLCLVAGKTL